MKVTFNVMYDKKNLYNMDKSMISQNAAVTQ